MALKRITALILAIVMTIGMFPVYTSAEEGASTAPTVLSETVPTVTTAPAAGNQTEETVPATEGYADTQSEKLKASVPAAGTAAASYQANVGKRAQFDLTYTNFPIVSDPAVITAASVFATEISVSKDVIPADLIVKIVACYVNEAEGLYWYQVEAAEGYTIPAEFPADPWVFQNYVGSTGGESLIILADPVCEICGSTNCTAEHILCGICGGYDCAALHFYCDICKDYDCGRDHLYCNLCGVYDCTRGHVWCGTCGSYDCGLEHEEWDAPVTVPVIPENPTLAEGEAVSIVDAEGSPVEGLLLRQGEKTSLSAWSDLEDASYQWQVCYDSAGDLWVDIQGQTGKGILISPAMFLSILDAQGTAAVRCVMTSGEELRTSVAIPVTVGERDAVYRMSASSTAAMAEAENPDELDKDYVVVQYVYSDGRTAASSDFATIIPGQAYSHSYALPVVTGYAPSLNTHKFGEKVKIENGKLVMNLAAGDLTDDYTIFTVTYSPDYVNYTVIHYWQNVEDDRYTEHERQTISTTHRTGEVIADAHKTYPGFYNLLYETPAAAADGSTVIEVYYDRYYYLMKFELDGGYGVDPIYARYGTELEVPNPTRPGYSFDGWTPDIPDTLPVGGGTYQAQWKTLGNTPYTVAYWIVNDDGSRTLIGSQIKRAVSGATVSGTNDLADAVICGEEKNHTHTADCYSCGIVEAHTHEENCFDSLVSNVPGQNGIDAIKAIEGGNPESGYVYVIKTENGNLWPKIYLNGNYYAVNGVGSGTSPATEAQVNAMISGEALGSATTTFTNETLTATKYKANTNCGKEQHIHNNCQICVEHTHTSACYYDHQYVEYLDGPVTIKKADGTEVTYATSENVVIKGDGSSVVDVYYEYKTYTIRFIYARRNGSSNQIATNTGDGSLTGNGGCSWTTVNNLPTFTDPSGETERSSVVIGNATYYYISVKAKFGEDIADLWPSANIGALGDYRWGSWAAAPGTGYRETYDNAHANIVGPYPTMSAEMIVKNPERLDDGSYLAQNMVAWWGNQNAWWAPANIENHAYHIYVEVLPVDKDQPVDGVTYVEFTNLDTKVTKKYKLDKTYTFTAAHNGDTRVDPIGITGLVCVNDTAKDNDKTNDPQANSKNFPAGNCSICKTNSCNYHNNFYYDRNMHKLYFWNYSNFLTEGKGSDVAYGSSLVMHGEYVGADLMAQDEYYPDGLEPDAYQFAGWYTTADCLDGTEMDWNSTMPDADMTVYAKWVPVSHSITFYLDRDTYDMDLTIPQQLNREPYTEKFADRSVTHGVYMEAVSDPGVAEGDEGAHPYTGYDFVGWFYLNDQGEETAFDPLNIPVTQDLKLYAKWSSNKLCYYNVYFALDENGDGVADTGESGIRYIADPISGSAIAGRTYTFSAKGGEELHDGYQEGYFPSTGSHSIVIDIADEDGTGANSFTFLYKPKTAVPYTVRYLDKDTGLALFDDKVVNENKNVVVTENYLYKQGYMPDAYQKTLVVSDDDVAGNDVIVFYYTKDEQHALYVVNHYIQELTPVETDESVTWVEAGWSKYTDLQYTGDIGTAYSAEAIAIDGFTLSEDHTNGYNVTQKINGAENTTLPTDVSGLSNGKLSGTLGDKGMELNFYYTRNLYPYEFRYMLNGTTVQLAKPEQGKAPFDTVVTMAAKEIEMDLDGDGINEDYRLYDPTETTKDIHIKVETGDTAVVNIATFYYVRCTQTMTITKTVVDNGTNTDPDPNQVFDFSLLIHAKNGYHRNSYDYRKSDGTTGSLSPEVSAPNTLRFTLKAGETITIEGLPTAEYTVSELDLPAGYYDSYSPAQKNKLTVDEQLDVTVANTYDPAILTVKKDYERDSTKEFSFRVTFGNGTTETFKLKHGETKTFENAPLGSYSVEELDLPLGIYQSATNATGSLDRGSNIESVFTNTYEPSVLEISKIVDVVEIGGNTAEVSSFKFTIAFPADVTPAGSYTYTIGNESKTIAVDGGVLTLWLQKGQTARFENLPVGTYTVTEEDYSIQGYNSYVRVDNAEYTENRTVQPELKRNTTTKVDFKNRFPVGDLQIDKTVTKEFSATPWDGDTFSFTVERTTTGRPLISGNQYEIYVDGTKADANAVVAEDGTLHVDIAFGADDAEALKTANVEVKHSIVIKDLPVGTYSVTETEEADYVQTPEGLAVTGLTLPAATAVKAEFSNLLIRPQGGLSLEKELIEAPGYNPNELPQGTKFSFTVELLEEPPESSSFTAVTTKENASTESQVTMAKGVFTVELEAGESVAINGLPIGTYRITEATIPYYANSFAHEVEGSWVQQAATATEDGRMYTEIQLPAGDTAKVKCTNIYPVDRAELIIQKQVEKAYSGDMIPDNSFAFTVTLAEKDGTIESYSYVVYGADGEKVREETATVQNKAFKISLEAGQYVVIANMPVCGYTVTETVDTLHYSAAYKVYLTETAEGGSKTVDTSGAVNASGAGTSVSRTFSAGKTDILVFTNTYKRHLTELTITKTGASVSDENQSFIFNVTSNSLTYGGSAVNMRVVITIPAGATSGSVTLTDMPLGTYSIAEEESWSWRYSDGGATVTLGEDALYKVTVSNTRTNPYWLSGADANKNIFDGTP